MNKIVLFSDSNCDLPKNIRDEHNIKLIRFSIFVNDKEYRVDPDWTNIGYGTVFNTLRDGNSIQILSATNYEIETAFKEELENGFDILYVGCAAKQSKTLHKVIDIAKMLKTEYPNQRIEVIDSLNASVGEGFVVLKAAELIEKSMNLDDVIKGTEAIRNKVVEYCTVETLTYLSRANRVKSRAAMFGNLFKVKPIIIADAEGGQVSITKIKGRKHSIDKCIEMFLENVENPEEQEIYIVHGDDRQAAEYVKEKILESNVKFKDIIIQVVGAVIGISTGPGMIAIFGLGKEVTFVGK